MANWCFEMLHVASLRLVSLTRCLVSLLWSSGQITWLKTSHCEFDEYQELRTPTRIRSIMSCLSVPIHSSKWLAGEGHAPVQMWEPIRTLSCLRESCTIKRDVPDYSPLYHAADVSHTTKTPTLSIFPPLSSLFSLNSLHSFFFYSSCPTHAFQIKSKTVLCTYLPCLPTLFSSSTFLSPYTFLVPFC